MTSFSYYKNYQCKRKLLYIDQNLIIFSHYWEHRIKYSKIEMLIKDLIFNIFNIKKEIIDYQYFLIRFDKKDKNVYLIGPFKIEKEHELDYLIKTPIIETIPLSKALLEIDFNGRSLPWSDIYDDGEKDFHDAMSAYIKIESENQTINGDYDLLDGIEIDFGYVILNSNKKGLNRIDLAQKFFF